MTSLSLCKEIRRKKFSDIFTNIIDNKLIKHNKYSSNNIKNITHSNKTIANELYNFIRNSTYFTRYNSKISGNTLNSKHNILVKANIYKQLYTHISKLYFDNNSGDKFKYITIDTSLIPNKLGTTYGRNSYYHNKNGVKIITICDSNGVPLIISHIEGNRSEFEAFDKIHESLKITPYKCENTINLRKN